MVLLYGFFSETLTSWKNSFKVLLALYCFPYVLQSTTHFIQQTYSTLLMNFTFELTMALFALFNYTEKLAY